MKADEFVPPAEGVSRVDEDPSDTGAKVFTFFSAPPSISRSGLS